MFSYILLFFSAVLFLSKGSNLKIEKKLYSLLTTSALFSYSILGLISIILISIDQSRFPIITLSIIIFFITIFFNKNYLKEYPSLKMDTNINTSMLYGVSQIVSIVPQIYVSTPYPWMIKLKCNDLSWAQLEKTAPFPP